MNLGSIHERTHLAPDAVVLPQMYRMPLHGRIDFGVDHDE